MLPATLILDERNHGIEAKERVCELYPTPEKVEVSVKDICKGDLYLVGLLWIAALKTVLLGPIPTISAAAKEPEIICDGPRKPAKMKYKDLPLYECPYAEYQDYASKKHHCPDMNKRMVHDYLLPSVSTWRKNVQDKARETCCTVNAMKDDFAKVFKTQADEFFHCMRCDGNYKVRYGILALGTLLGFKLGKGGFGYSKRIIFSTLGALGAGALCFPNETDAIFKNCMYHVGSTVVSFYNLFCGKNAVLPTKVPCHEDHPHQE